MKPRDRIIELIQKVQYLGGIELRLADHLLANGVTVGGEWISVADRLPEQSGEYIVYWKFPDGRRDIFTDRFYFEVKQWGTEFYITGKPTYWMPLPEPTKEG